MKKMSVAIIGSGESGLVSAKEALQQGLEVVIFEKNYEIGGLWHPIFGAMWETMKTNLSYLCCMFSDFPWPKDTPLFPTARAVYSYLQAYARYFNLYPHIKFNSEVTKIKYLVTGQWQLTIINQALVQMHKFDYVIVASGVLTKPYIPPVAGLSALERRIIHSRAYEQAYEYKNQRVLVIGNAFSGAEIAAEVADSAKTVVNLIHRPTLCLNRYIAGKFPLDLILYSRAAKASYFKKSILTQLASRQATISPLLQVDNLDSIPITVSDHYLKHLRTGKIQLKQGELDHIDFPKVSFNDETEQNFDSIIFCTGYQTEFNFLDASTLETLFYQAEDRLKPVYLYRGTFNPNLKNIAFVGLYRGAYFGVIELQARWASLIFSGKMPWPTTLAFEAGMLEEQRIRFTLPRAQLPYPDYVGFADAIAREIKAFPNLSAVEPEIREQINSGPVLSAHYRLSGPGAHPIMAKTIIQTAQKILSFR